MGYLRYVAADPPRSVRLFTAWPGQAQRARREKLSTGPRPFIVKSAYVPN